MKKGDESRSRILEAAERLFAARGYEAVGIQDILDQLGISKGAFYHHFESKSALLEQVCLRRAEQWYTEGVRSVRERTAPPPEKLSAALRLMNALEKGGPFMLNVYAEMGVSRADGPMIAVLRSVTVRLLVPLVEEILDQGVREGFFTVRRTDQTARLITLLALDVNEEATAQISLHRGEKELSDRILDLLDTYRESVELLVNAPYGSVSLFDLGKTVETVSRAAEQAERRHA